MNQETMTQETRARDMARAISDFVNAFSFPKEEFAQQVVYRTHRTLQQSICGMMFRVIQEWAIAYEEGIYDGRNEATCKICHDLVKAMKEKDPYWDSLPLV